MPLLRQDGKRRDSGGVKPVEGQISDLQVPYRRYLIFGF